MPSSMALYAVIEEEAGDMPPAVVFRSGLRHVADFRFDRNLHWSNHYCVACHNLLAHFREEVRAAGPGWATLGAEPSSRAPLPIAAPTPVSSTPPPAPSLRCLPLFGPPSFSPPTYTPAP